VETIDVDGNAASGTVLMRIPWGMPKMQPYAKALVRLHQYWGGHMNFKIEVEALNTSKGSLIVGIARGTGLSTPPATINIYDLYELGAIELSLNCPSKQSASFTLVPTANSFKMWTSNPTTAFTFDTWLCIAVKTPMQPTFPDASTMLTLTLFNNMITDIGHPGCFYMTQAISTASFDTGEQRMVSIGNKNFFDGQLMSNLIHDAEVSYFAIDGFSQQPRKETYPTRYREATMDFEVISGGFSSILFDDGLTNPKYFSVPSNTFSFGWFGTKNGNVNAHADPNGIYGLFDFGYQPPRVSSIQVATESTTGPFNWETILKQMNSSLTDYEVYATANTVFDYTFEYQVITGNPSIVITYSFNAIIQYTNYGITIFAYRPLDGPARAAIPRYKTDDHVVAWTARTQHNLWAHCVLNDSLNVLGAPPPVPVGYARLGVASVLMPAVHPDCINFTFLDSQAWMDFCNVLKNFFTPASNQKILIDIVDKANGLVLFVIHIRYNKDSAPTAAVRFDYTTPYYSCRLPISNFIVSNVRVVALTASGSAITIDNSWLPRVVSSGRQLNSQMFVTQAVKKSRLQIPSDDFEEIDYSIFAEPSIVEAQPKAWLMAGAGALSGIGGALTRKGEQNFEKEMQGQRFGHERSMQQSDQWHQSSLQTNSQDWKAAENDQDRAHSLLQQERDFEGRGQLQTQKFTQDLSFMRANERSEARQTAGANRSLSFVPAGSSYA